MSVPPSAWLVPPALHEQLRGSADEWLARVPGICADLETRWGLRVDGDAWSGFHSAVWPVRDAHEARLVLKVTQPGMDTRPEATALRHWAGSGASVRLLAGDEKRNALLLNRLAPTSLEVLPDIDRACEVIGTLIAALPDAAPPTGFETTATEAARMADNIGRASASVLPPRATRRAVSTLRSLQVEASTRLLHFDAHFLNVLPVLDAEEDDHRQWRLIDPLPRMGPVEWEPVALLRNRWSDAVATGDPDRALRRRVDQFAEIVGADAARCREIAQAVAVDNLLHLLEEDPGHMFVPPYRLMSAWEPGAAGH